MRERELSTVEKMLLGVPVEQMLKLVPGLLLAAVITAIGTCLAGFIGTDVMGFEKSPVSAIMMAIIIGLVVRNLLGMPEIFKSGVDFCVKKVLRLGIILMGIRLSILQLAKIGALGVPIVLLCITAGLVFTIYLSSLLRLPRRLGILIAVGTGICGASAIVATAPGIDASDEETAYAIATITIFGIIAMLLYPFLGHLVFGGNQILVGLFLGTSIHETAQVTGAGLIYDSQFLVLRPTAADVAIVVKLVRNALMALVIPLMILVNSRRVTQAEDPNDKSTSVASLFPTFILGFILMAALRSLGDAGIQAGGRAFAIWTEDTWRGVYQGTTQLTGYLLAIAMAGVGLGASYRAMRNIGIKPFYVGFFAAVLVGVVSTVFILVLGSNIAL